jgi:GNAT superfamily N-acetyltransferase
MRTDNITFRLAIPADVERIAALHARSWQETYRGIMPDDYLDNDVADERLAVWQERFAETPANRRIIVAEAGNELAGFACVFTNDESVYGALLDNLHVSSGYQGQGIGKQLMQQAAEWVQQQMPESAFYLWVYEKNHPARAFYEYLGATNYHAIDGEFGTVLRYIWRDTQTLLTACTR